MHTLLHDTYYIGVNDRTTSLFEGMWPLPQGVSYNSYLIADEKVCLIDTVEISYLDVFIDKIHALIGDRTLDYLVVNHMEPDHSGSIRQLQRLYPNLTIVGNKQTMGMIEGYYGLPVRQLLVSDGDTLNLGKHTLRFYLTPMVHWPETMMTLDETTHALFSGDAFGSFGALHGAVVDERMDTDRYWDEMARYYANIVGKYGNPVQKALAKFADIPIHALCSTHGPVWTGDRIAKVVGLYDRMSRYETRRGVVIAYASMYGHTEQLAERIAEHLSEQGVQDIVMHRLNNTHSSYVLRDVFQYKGLLIGSPTYSNRLYPEVESFLSKLAVREVKHHVIGFFGSFTWAGAAVKQAVGWADQLPQNEFLTQTVELKQARYADVAEDCRLLAADCVAHL